MVGDLIRVALQAGVVAFSLGAYIAIEIVIAGWADIPVVCANTFSFNGL